MLIGRTASSDVLPRAGEASSLNVLRDSGFIQCYIAQIIQQARINPKYVIDVS